MIGTQSYTIDSDADLVERIRQGDVDAYGVLVERYQRLIRAAVQNIVRDRHAAEDAAQESLIAAFDSLSTLRDPAKFAPWLLAIARHQATRAVRTRVRAEVCVPNIEAVEHDRNGRLGERSERLLELVERLPDHERIVIGLRYFDGHSVENVARICGRSIGTVTKQLSRAHVRLEQWLKQEIPS